MDTKQTVFKKNVSFWALLKMYITYKKFLIGTARAMEQDMRLRNKKLQVKKNSPVVKKQRIDI